MKMTFKSKITILLLFIVSVILSACAILPTSKQSKEEIDPPQESVSYEDDLELADEGEKKDDEALDESVKTELYLIDKNGYVVPQTFFLPVTESVAQQALEYLVVDGPVTDLLPDNFRAVIPADTEISVDVKDGVAIVDFSKEFAEYNPEDETRILQSITWTLTQFDSIDAVKIQMNGKPLKEMPVNGTPINGELSRTNGINIDLSGVADITNTYPITVYYIAQTNEQSYYVPVTKRVSKEQENDIQTIVEELVNGPGINSPLYTLFMPDVELLEEPTIKNGVVTLNFNENIYGSIDQKLITNQVLEPLVLSLTEREEIEAVSIEVNGEANIMNQDGKPVTEPVSRPESINAIKF